MCSSGGIHQACQDAVLTEARRPGVPAPSWPSHPLQSEPEKSDRKIRNHRPTELGSIDCTLLTTDGLYKIWPVLPQWRIGLFIYLFIRFFDRSCDDFWREWKSLHATECNLKAEYLIKSWCMWASESRHVSLYVSDVGMSASHSSDSMKSPLWNVVFMAQPALKKRSDLDEVVTAVCIFSKGVNNKTTQNIRV